MLTLQFGQCGNQLGESLFEKINSDIKLKSYRELQFSDAYKYTELSNLKWFEGISEQDHRFARSILIDTEKKVVDKLLKKSRDGWCYRSKNAVSIGSTNGSANNWTYGFTIKGPEYEDTISDIIRTELERTDCFEAFLCLLSCAGGTGSGLGNFIIQTLRDNYPTKSILTSLVLPFRFGEVATQNYNIILCLAKILDNADLVIILENEKLRSELIKLNSGRSKTSLKIEFPKDINDIASEKLLSVLQPAKEVSGGRYNGTNFILSKLCPHPASKVVTIEAVSCKLENFGSLQIWDQQTNSSQWQTHFNTLESSISNIPGSRSIANILLTRGTSNLSNYHLRKQLNLQRNDEFLINNQFMSNKQYANLPWLNSSEQFTHFHQNRRFLTNEKFTSIITNNSRVIRSFEDILQDGWKIYSHGAFLHRYKQYGLEDDDILRAFTKVENIVKSYKNLEVNI